MRTKELDTIGNKNNLTYVFRSNNDLITDRKRFFDFIYFLIKKMKNDYLTDFIKSGISILKSSICNIRDFKLSIYIYDPDPGNTEESIIGTVNLIFDPVKLNARMNIIIDEEEQISQTLKMEYDSINKQYYYYARK